MLNLKFICVIDTVSTYLGKWGERVNFGNIVAEISTKVWEKKRKKWERENAWISLMWLPKFLLLDQPARVCVLCARSGMC